jgi:type I restriction enzyme S subunit
MGADGTKVLEIINFNAFPKFIYYYLTSINITNTGYNRHFKFVKDLVFPLPPLTTQKHIAEILDNAAALRDKTQQLLTEYDQLAQSIFLEMFGDPVINPKSWEEKFLKTVTDKIGSGATPKGGKNSYKDEGIPLIRSLNIHDNYFKTENLAFIDDDQAKKLNNVSLEEKDVLFNITGASVARCAIVPKDFVPGRVNQHVSILRPKKEQLNSAFLLHLIISPNSKAKLLGVGKNNAATRESITKIQLREFKIINPPIYLQNQFAEKIALIEQQKELEKQELKESEDLFQALLQKAFKGELVD